MTKRLENWQVRTMRRAFADGATIVSLAEYYGLSRQHTSRIIRGLERAADGGPLHLKPVNEYRARLTDAQAEEIRWAVHNGERPVVVAERYDVSAVTVTTIIRGRTHRHVGGPRTVADQRRNNGGRPRILTTEQRGEIVDLLRRGERVTDLAEKFNVSWPLISKIRKEHNILPVRGTGRCPKGHLLSLPDGYTDSTGRIRCRACRSRRQREYRRVTATQLLEEQR